MEKYTHDTLLTSGKHKFTRLCRVPPDYLLKFVKDKRDRALHEYVMEHLEDITRRASDGDDPPALVPTCKKIQYLSKKEANAFLASIGDLEQAHKKPVRSYECDVCGMWHVTSKA